MKDIRCPKCNRIAKFEDCVCNESGRKRVMLKFPCYHYTCLVYNVPLDSDKNSIIKAFNSVSEKFFNLKSWDIDRFKFRKDIYLD